LDSESIEKCLSSVLIISILSDFDVPKVTNQDLGLVYDDQKTLDDDKPTFSADVKV